MGSYALPLPSNGQAGGHSPFHGYSKSHSHALLERSPSWTLPTSNSPVRKQPSFGSIDSTNRAAFEANARRDSYNYRSSPALNTSQGFQHISLQDSPMKGRPRGESDLGRPTVKTNGVANGYGFPPLPELVETPRWESRKHVTGSVADSASAAASTFSLAEIATAILIPLPFLLAALAYPTASPLSLHTPNEPPSKHTYEHLVESITEEQRITEATVVHNKQSTLLHACTLASGTLLLVGILARIHHADIVLDRRKAGTSKGDKAAGGAAGLLRPASLAQILTRMLSILLPFYAAMQLGGTRIGLVLLSTIASAGSAYEASALGLGSSRIAKQVLQFKPLTLVVIAMGLFTDLVGLTLDLNILAIVMGYIALVVSAFLIPPPLASTTTIISQPTSRTSTPIARSATWDTPAASPVTILVQKAASSPIIRTPQDATLTLVAGTVLCAFSITYSMLMSTAPPISYYSMAFSTLSMTSAAALLFFGQPSSLQTRQRVGVAVGSAVLALFDIVFQTGGSTAALVQTALCAFSYSAVLYDRMSITSAKKEDDTHSHTHAHQANKLYALHGKHSALTKSILGFTEPGSIVHSILIEKDSRRIFYFGCLNLGFMMVQFFYGYVSGSLGLITDSIHMFFDCAGLAVGLAAAVMSKWPSNIYFPYGYGKIDTLSGFANGIFLMLVSVEIVFDAFERLMEGHELRRIDELLVVSILGLLVNIVGLTAFGHAHHGHDHSHGHSHDHSHDEHEHDHADSHAHGGHSHEGHHHHDNENMHGIFLHVLADTLGSVAVIISTLLAKYVGWSGWDPIAGCLVAILIFLSAIPLVKSAGMRLLLSLPADVEYGCRNTLKDLSTLRGVMGYSVPRFWLEDAGAAHAEVHAHDENEKHHDHEHDHAHHQSHDHSHSHGHKHDHSHSHHHQDKQSHSHSHNHDHTHDHTHDHAHKHGPTCNGEAHLHHEPPPAGQKILGVIHIIASRTADLEDVRQRASAFLVERNMNVVVHVEREGEGRCWCGGGART